MPVFWFYAPQVHPQTQQPQPFQVGDIESFVLNLPPGSRKEDAISYARSKNMGAAGRLKYLIIEVPPDDPTVMLLAVQRYGLSSPQQMQLSGEHVNGGMPTGAPRGQNQGRPAGPVDPQSGFQPLGDADLDGGDSDPYSGGEDGTYADIVRDGGGIRDIPRGA